MKRLFFSLAALLTAVQPYPAAAQYPDKPITVIVPYAAGGAGDVAIRAVSEPIEKALGQRLVITARPGAGGNIGAQAVVTADPDGYTLLLGATNNFVINQFLFPNMTFDPLTALVPIAKVADVPSVLFTHPSVPAKTLPEFIAYAKANPGKLGYASFGAGSYPHVVSEQLKRMAGIDLIHVPYKGSAAAVTDMLGGQLSMLIVTLSVFEQHEKSGRIKVLAAATDRRLTLRPDLPTVSESGVSGYSVSVWFGLAAPAGTPEAVLDRIHTDVTRILANPAYRERYVAALSLEPGGMSRAAFAALLREEEARWGQLVRDSGARLD